MELVLAMDLKRNRVVHGKSGQRADYQPLDWGVSKTAFPPDFIRAVAPKFVYIADLDRIEGAGSHDRIVAECARLVSACYVDRGCRSPEDLLCGYHITNIVGTETAGEDLARYGGGLLSIDIRDGAVIPSKRSPEAVLRQANGWRFTGCIILSIGAVGTGAGLDYDFLDRMRSVYHRKLYWGGGVATTSDLQMLSDAGFDGAIIATALHKGQVPLAWIRRGYCC
jgi:phosphoribosylformimino-5-aminoimidazole carboxamide ribotide isomerase